MSRHTVCAAICQPCATDAFPEAEPLSRLEASVASTPTVDPSGRLGGGAADSLRSAVERVGGAGPVTTSKSIMLTSFCCGGRLGGGIRRSVVPKTRKPPDRGGFGIYDECAILGRRRKPVPIERGKRAGARCRHGGGTIGRETRAVNREFAALAIPGRSRRGLGAPAWPATSLTISDIPRGPRPLSALRRNRQASARDADRRARAGGRS